MTDGVRLSARIWLPTASETKPVPAILEYIPYRKRDMVRIRDERNHPFFAAAGYAAIRVDMRGSGDSEGCMSDMYSAEELDDAVRVIEWIAQQTWCDGQVGMMGTSWGGTSSLQIASRRPAALKAVIAVCATNNRFDDDIHHMGGCLLTDTVEWGATLPAILASPPDPETVGEAWREIWLARLEQLSFPLEHWVAHQTRDDYWQWGSVNENPDAIRCPVLMVGGWADRYSNTVMNFLEQTQGPSWGIIGAWGHHYPDQASPAPGIAFQQEARRWWDHWLRGSNNGIDEEPRLRVWMQEYAQPADTITTRPGRWIAEPVWPSNNIRSRSYYLNNGSLLPDQAETQQQSLVPGSITTGKAAGDTGYFGRAGGLPLDQREDDEQSLVFESEPLQQPVEILGSVTLKLDLTRDLRSAMLIVRLNDVHPDGSVARVSYVVRNLALDQRSCEVDTQDPAQVKHLQLRFHNTAYRFAAGHRIRLAMSSAYWPIIWPSPAVAQISLFQASLHLTLPVLVQSHDYETSNFATRDQTKPAIKAEPAYVVRSAPKLRRWSDADDNYGIQSIHWHQPFHRVYYPDINLTFGFETTAKHQLTLPDPNSAASCFEHTLQYTRDGWDIKVTCTAQLRATETHFKMEGKILITENDQIVFTRWWSPESIRYCS